MLIITDIVVVLYTVQKAGSLNKKGEIVDHQPVTLHTKIKSSGYSRQAPRFITLYIGSVLLLCSFNDSLLPQLTTD